MKKFKNVADAVEQYVAFRDELRIWKKQVDEEEAKRKESLTEIEMWLLTQAEKMGVDSFKTPFGTAYKQISEHYRVGNWNEIVAYIKKTGYFHILEKRIAKLAVKEIQSQEGAIPPGVDYTSEFVVHVLRPGKKTKDGGD